LRGELRRTHVIGVGRAGRQLIHFVVHEDGQPTKEHRRPVYRYLERSWITPPPYRLPNRATASVPAKNWIWLIVSVRTFRSDSSGPYSVSLRKTTGLSCVPSNTDVLPRSRRNSPRRRATTSYAVCAWVESICS